MLISFLMGSALCQAAEDNWEFSLDGYYRVRTHSFHNLYADQDEAGRYITHRLRLQPQLNFQNRAKFIMMTDVIDDAVWGDNQSIASTALFADDPSLTSVDGTAMDQFRIKRAWFETNLAIGVLRVGRQESHWGMGLLANSGNGFDDPFGENHLGATFDRIVFATRPIAVAKTLMGKGGSDAPFYMGYAFDRLVESPEIKYYGYKCEKGIGPEDDSYDSRCYNSDYDVAGDGLTNLEHGYTDDTITGADRNRDWLMDNEDDVNEHVVLALYKGENVPMFGSVGDLTLGMYGINRNQAETESNVYIWDAYLNFLYKGIYAEGEVVNIRGSSRAIALPGATNSEGDPLYKDVNIWGYVSRLGYKSDSLTAYFETGFAGGDDAASDSSFTGRAIHPDYNVGLLLYDQVLATATANAWGDAAAALWSGGGVYNSRYIHPLIRYSPIANWELLGGFVMAWPDKPDGAIIQCTEADLNDSSLSCSEANATSNHIGWEGNLALKARLHEHILFSAETGYAQVTDRIKLENVGMNPEGNFFTVQTRMAYEF